MELTKKPLKQFFFVTALIVLALLVVNSLGIDLAFAQLSPEEDQPAIIKALSGGQTGLRGLLVSIVNFFLGFLGLLAVIMVIYGGFLYVSSAGNEENVNKAKKILLYAAIGIIVIIVSFVLVQTILTAATGQPQ